MRWALKICLFITGFAVVSWFCRQETEGFTFVKVKSSLPFHPEWEVAPLSAEESDQILSQPFRYLAKGAQAYVFASADGKYVLKLFRHDRMHAPFWMTLLPLKSFQVRAEVLNARLYRDFNSYKIAYDELKEETGLIYAHLNKTPFFPNQVELIDKLGISHRVDLNQLEFILQKRADLLYVALQNQMEVGKKEEAQAVLRELVQLIAGRCKKGIFDKDPDLNTNFGVVDGRPIQIDVGRFRKDPAYQEPKLYKSEILRITDNLHQWLRANYPELEGCLKDEISAL